MELEKAIDTLRDESESWVSRRDAVEELRQGVLTSIRALQSQAETKDTDVKMAVHAALNELSAPQAAAAAPAEPEPKSMEELVRACEKTGRRDVYEEGDGFRIEVSLKKTGRKQQVYVTNYKRKDGIKLIRVCSYCGKADTDTYIWALRANAKLVASATALIDNEGAEHLALTRVFLDGEVTKPEMHTAIKEIAHYADWLESKISDKDDF